MARSVETLIRSALSEVEIQMARAFHQVGDEPEPGSDLDQLGLRDGGSTVEGYLHHGEWGLALEHLIYMVREPHLPISRVAFSQIDEAGRAMGIDPGTWESLRPA